MNTTARRDYTHADITLHYPCSRYVPAHLRLLLVKRGTSTRALKLAARTSRKFGLKANSLWHEALIIDYGVKLGCGCAEAQPRAVSYSVIRFIRNEIGYLKLYH